MADTTADKNQETNEMTQTADATATVKTDKAFEWDGIRQMLDQEKANTRKLSQERETMATQLGQMTAKVEQLERAIADSRQQQTDLKELDPNSADIPELVKSHKALLNQLKDTQSRLSQLSTVAQQYQLRETQREAEAARARVIEKIMKPLDEEFGAKYRNAAKKLADTLVEEGRETQPQDQFDAYVLLRKCYQQAASKDEKPSKKTVAATDSGSGGHVAGRFDTVGEGKLEDIMAKARKVGLKALLGKT